MMGRTHVFSGMAAGAATLPVASWAGVLQPEPWSQLAWVVVVAGYAMWPDLDHPSATVTRMWGPLSAVVGRVVYWLGRGHRGGSHDPLLAPVAFGVLAYVASWHPISAAVAVAVAVGLAVRACEFVIPGRTAETAVVNLALSVTAGVLFAIQPVTLAWLPFAVGLGAAVHIVGDACTPSGVPTPFAWLTKNAERHRYRGPLETGSALETWIVAPGLLVAAAAALYMNIPAIHRALS